jgi:cAMP phosphodiesterase
LNIVFNTGILLNSFLFKFKKYFPTKVTDNIPIKVMRKKVIKISNPGISKGNKLFGFRYLGSKLENALSTNKEKYIVMPIGIKTTIPAKK